MESIFAEIKTEPKGKRATYFMSNEVLDKLTKLANEHNLSKSEILRRLVLNTKV